MPWVKLDDHFDEHVKFAKAGPLGIALWVSGLAYCNRNLTDGFIPWAVALRLMNWKFLGEGDEAGRRLVYQVAVTSGVTGDDVTSEFVASLLVRAGLWEETAGGYLVHDYGDYQQSRDDVLKDRARNAARQERFRRNVLTNEPSNAHHNGVTNEPSNAVSVRSPDLTPVRTPVPDPDPDQIPVDAAVAAPAVFDAIGQALVDGGWPPPATRSERGKWGAGCRELREAGETPSAVTGLAKEYERRWPHLERSHNAIASNLSRLRKEPRPERSANGAPKDSRPEIPVFVASEPGDVASPEVARMYLAEVKQGLAKLGLKTRIGGSPPERNGPEIDDPAVIARRERAREDALRVAGQWREPTAPNSPGSPDV